MKAWENWKTCWIHHLIHIHVVMKKNRPSHVCRFKIHLDLSSSSNRNGTERVFWSLVGTVYFDLRAYQEQPPTQQQQPEKRIIHSIIPSFIFFPPYFRMMQWPKANGKFALYWYRLLIFVATAITPSIRLHRLRYRIHYRLTSIQNNGMDEHENNSKRKTEPAERLCTQCSKKILHEKKSNPFIYLCSSSSTPSFSVRCFSTAVTSTVATTATLVYPSKTYINIYIHFIRMHYVCGRWLY